MRKTDRLLLALLCMIPLLFWSTDGSALPVFARKYHTACTTCHVAFPIRNGFGEAFRNNGYRFPAGQDEDMVKEEPIKLGQESYKKVFPDAIWPSDMPNMPTLGFLGKIRAYTPKDEVSGSYKATKVVEDLETFFAGTVTEQITYFGDFAFNEGGVEWGKLNLMWTFRPGLNLVLGEVGITEKMVLVSARPGWKRDGYTTTMPGITRGAEIRYAGDTGETGGYSLSAGIGRNSTEDPEDAGNIGDSKYVRATYKIGGHGLLSGVGGKHGVEHIGMDNGITFGVNLFNSVKGGQPATQEDLAGLTKTAYSADIEAAYGSLRILGQYARFNEVLDETDKSINYGKRTAYSIEGDYWFYPWLVGVMRYEYLKDNYNGTMRKVIPAVAIMLRPNAKIGLEYVNVSHDKKISSYTAPSSFQLFTQVGF
ncbi:MAG: hypothetical protein HGB22_09080 [Chlorobiaceae bacterium]|nr:hypothetical protein [Chlorobiaceae bacterium]